MRSALALFVLALFTACSVPGTRQPDRYFVLEVPPGPPAAVQVRVAPTSAAGFYDTQALVYSREPGTRAYYQFNHWTEPPQRAIHAQLAARLASGGRRGDLVLRTHLVEIYHDAATQPGSARITLRAQLVNAASGEIREQRVFSRAAPAISYDAAGAVQGFRTALAALLDDVVAWVEAQAAGKVQGSSLRDRSERRMARNSRTPSTMEMT